MQVQAQQAAKPSDAQIQAQIDNMHWQEKQQEMTNAFNRQQQQWQRDYTIQQSQIEHEHYMVDHLADPILILLALLIAGRVIWGIARASIDAGIQKNKDDNAADVRRSQDILDKNEGITD